VNFINKILGSSKSSVKKELEEAIDRYTEEVHDSVNTIPVVDSDIQYSIIIECKKDNKLSTRIVQNNTGLIANESLIKSLAEAISYLKREAGKNVVAIVEKGMGSQFAGLVKAEIKKNRPVSEKPLIDSSQVFGNFMGEDDF